MTQTFRQRTQALVILFPLLFGCGGSSDKPLTEEEARAREVSERDDRLHGLRFGAYQKVRNGVFSNGADPVFHIAGNDLRFLLGLMYAGAGHRRLALYEASGFDLSAAENERAKAGYHFLRGYVYSSYGWTRLAREEFEIVATFETGNPDHADLVERSPFKSPFPRERGYSSMGLTIWKPPGGQEPGRKEGRYSRQSG